MENVRKEIAKDRSLAEFQGKQVVSAQLRQILEQRANSWVERVYGFCCDTYESRGKAISADFDRAIWMYSMEPFILGEKVEDIHKETMCGFLELLLCAVGSPREQRRFLTVSQKDCCLSVRRSIFDAWNAQLDQPSRSPVSPASHRSSPAGVNEQSILVRPSVAEAVVPSLTPTVTEAETHGTGGVDMSIQLKTPDRGTWDAIEISFLSEERVQIRNRATTETHNYAEFGFEDRRTGKPNLAWKTLIAIAEQRGTFPNAAKTGREWVEVEKRIQEIRKVLRKHFRISADPIPFVDGTGYKALFKINFRPSFHT